EAGNWYTGLLGDHGSELSANGDGRHRRLFFEDDAVPALPADGGSVADAGERVLCSAMPGTVVSLAVEVGQVLAAGDELLVMESMKMEHVIAAPVAGELLVLDVAAGDTVSEGQRLLLIKETQGEVTEPVAEEAPDLERVRPDLAEVVDRHAFGLDENRPDVVARRRKTGQRTARENVDDLCDAGSFEEYGALVIAAQRGRREMADLIRKTPGDGMVCGLGRVNGDVFADDSSRCVVMSYDYSVLAGTQGMLNHRKKDRMFEIAREQRLPVVIFTEGGGGRPGDTDAPGVAGLDCLAFRYFGELSGLVPLVGVNSGYCFAGNAALLGCCDVIIATRNSSIGMGGPAMIEGGGLGVFHPTEVGPAAVQSANGVVDVLVDDEEQAVATAKRYLSYFQGPVDDWQAADQRLLREAIPENRLRVYDVRSVIETLADENSVLELRGGFGAGMVTALARIEGRPLGILANNPGHLAGAIDPDGADKAARFMQLCDAFDLPVLSLCDTPGIMVGPEIEKLANVRHASRMFVVGASMTVPFMTIVLRKGYGLGAQAMAAGSFHAPLFTVSWPTGEFGGMGLEGAVKLGFRKELEAVDDPQERRELYEKMVARAYEVGKAVNMASHFEIDDVIDPADSRQRVVSALRSVPDPAPRTEKKRPCIDTW
ncbi:MAG: carboxyl transferase domain-containing protein, partial [bacterium]